MNSNQSGNEHPAGAMILARPDGTSIAYRRILGKSPGVVFLHGYRSDMEGGKAQALEATCRNLGHAFLRFDGFGHGASSGDVEMGTIGRWADDAAAVLDALTEGPQVLVGSSMGGWVALLAALRRPEKVAALVGIAAAPDFTEDLMWDKFTPEQQQEMLNTGSVTLPNCVDPAHPWRIAHSLIQDGRNHLLLRSAITLHCPVRLIQGQKDADVPWLTAVKLADRLESDDVQITLIKDGDHRLSRPQDLERLCQTVSEILASAK